MNTDQFYKIYESHGFIYPNEILTRYALSLATKPFVILSGISGTGKTKIAQLFEVPIPELKLENHQKTETGYILLNITDGLINGDGRANLKYSDLPNILEPDQITQIDQAIADKRRRNDNGNICDVIPFKIKISEGSDIKVGLYLQRASSPLVRLRFKSIRGSAEQYDSRPYFDENYKIGDVLKLKKIGRNQLEISSTNDSESVKNSEVDSYNRITEISRKCFVSVKSNWTDNTEVFGFRNPITNKYTMTKLLKFILKAHDNPKYPFFLILDEMNIATVEHYFSDFLSCIESRINKDDEIDQEGINLSSGSDLIETDDDEYDLISANLKLPLNLYVTGTVNIDDTTSMFSPKVLDRANVIEFNDVILEQINRESGLKLKSFPDFGNYKLSNMKMFSDLSEDTQKKIKDILNILKEYNLHFGFRTISEMSHFIINAKNCVNSENGLNVEIEALDIQILQKVLPKLYGSYAKLYEPLKTLILYFASDTELRDLTKITEEIIIKCPFRRSLEKCIKMENILSNQGFVSFIE